MRDLAALLVEAGVASAADVERAAERQRERGGRLDTALLELELLPEDELAGLLCRASGLGPPPPDVIAAVVGDTTYESERVAVHTSAVSVPSGAIAAFGVTVTPVFVHAALSMPCEYVSRFVLDFVYVSQLPSASAVSVPAPRVRWSWNAVVVPSPTPKP